MDRKTFASVGAGVGFAAFLAIGMMPALLYGGYAGVLVAGGAFGAPIQPALLVRALVFCGMVMGVLGGGSLFALGGAAGGLALSKLLRDRLPLRSGRRAARPGSPAGSAPR